MRINYDYQHTSAYSAGPALLPEGDYSVEIVNEREQPLQSGKGTKLVFELVVLSGPSKGARVFDSLNLGHVDQLAREIAQRRLKSIGNAVGAVNLLDTTELFRKPFNIHLSVREWNGRQYNNVDDYFQIQSVLDQASAVSQTTTPAPAQTPAPAPFWGQRQ